MSPAGRQGSRPSAICDGSQPCEATRWRRQVSASRSAERLPSVISHRSSRGQLPTTRTPGYLLTVKQISVFGSYLDPDMDRLGDLDLWVTVGRRETHGERHVDRVLEYARASGRRFGVFTDDSSGHHAN